MSSMLEGKRVLLKNEDNETDTCLPGRLDLTDKLLGDCFLELRAQMFRLKGESAGEENYKEHFYI